MAPHHKFMGTLVYLLAFSSMMALESIEDDKDPFKKDCSMTFLRDDLFHEEVHQGSIQIPENHVLRSNHGPGFKHTNDAIQPRELANIIDTRPDLTWINLQGTPLSSDHIKALQNAQNLKFLNIAHCRLTDETLRNFPELPGLLQLNIGYNYITDEGLKFIKRLRALKHLIIRNNKLTSKGINELEKRPFTFLYVSGSIT